MSENGFCCKFAAACRRGVKLNLFSGTCMLIAPFKTAARPLIRDLVIYLWACYWMFQCLYKGKMELFDAIGLLVRD